MSPARRNKRFGVLFEVESSVPTVWVPPVNSTTGLLEFITSCPPSRMSNRSPERVGSVPMFKVLPALKKDPEIVIFEPLSPIRKKSFLVSTVLPLNCIRGSVEVLVNVEPSVTLKKRLVMLKVLPESLTSGPASVTVDGAEVPGLKSFTFVKVTRLEPISKVLFVNCMRGVGSVLSSFPFSDKKMNEQQLPPPNVLKVLKVLPVALSSGPARDTVLAVAFESLIVRKFPAVSNVLALNVTRGSVPVLVSVELSVTIRNEFRLIAASPAVKSVFVALMSAPLRLRLGGSPVELLKRRKFRSVSTVLPLS